MRYLIKGAEFPQLNERALSRGAAMKNIELSLAIIWRSKAVNSSRIATSAEIFEGNKLKIMVMIQEIFDVYVRRPLYSQAIKMLSWYNKILRMYNRRLPVGVFTESDFSGVWSCFQSGTAIFCVIYHFFGPAMIGEGVGVVRVDPMRIVNKPTNVVEFRSNVIYSFQLLKALGIEVCWDPMDWVTFPDVDFTMIQLQYIYNALKGRNCVLPPATGNQAGVTSAANGEPLVVGVVFSDTITVSIPNLSSSAPAQPQRRSVGMVGIGDDSIKLLTIDTSGHTGRFANAMCPYGLLSSNMKIAQAPVAVKVPPYSHKF